MTDRFQNLTAVALALLIWAGGADGRTIFLDLSQCDQMAALDAEAPTLGWAMQRDQHETIRTSQVVLNEGRAFLLRFDLGTIPPGHRVVHAELFVPANDPSGDDPRLYLWRLINDWGAGVCHSYRSIENGEFEPWTLPGARGLASDRAMEPTAVLRVVEPGLKTINVTEDVEMWHRGVAPNQGWLFSVEDPYGTVRLASPLWDRGSGWALRVTYEPEDE